jgi:hypothetical protein
MRSRNPFLLVLLSLALLGAAAQEKTPKTQPKAQTGPTQPKDNPYVERFKQLDRNGDGYVVLSEWPLDESSFHLVDRNKDNRLNPEELLTPNVLRREDRFRQLDANGDGRLGPTERRRGGTLLDNLDRDKDGYVTLREYDQTRNIGDVWSRRATTLDQQRFRSLDLNRDNRLTRSEWTGGGPSFERFDRNRDGVISPSEWQ